VSERLLHDLHRDAGREHQGRRAVAKVVQPYRWESRGLGEILFDMMEVLRQST
jgi:hypothetical protein